MSLHKTIFIIIMGVLFLPRTPILLLLQMMWKGILEGPWWLILIREGEEGVVVLVAVVDVVAVVVVVVVNL